MRVSSRREIMEWRVGGAALEGDLWTILHCLFRVEKGRMLKKQGKGTRFEGGLWGKHSTGAHTRD